MPEGRMVDGEEVYDVGQVHLFYDRLRALVDVGIWYTYREQAVRDVHAHRPTCDFASPTLGDRPKACECWSMGTRAQQEARGLG